MSKHDSIINRERVATRVSVRTVKKGEAEPDAPGFDMTVERFTWLNKTACADLTIGHFFVEAGHAISEEVLNVCRGCPVRLQCLEHAYSMGIAGGYFGGMSPGQRRSYDIDQAKVFIANDPIKDLR